ncbi:MAG: MFS transporter [Dehalococcoidia bacterium]|nr:MFS transporter [Dehalococcoidia bacterium]
MTTPSAQARDQAETRNLYALTFVVFLSAVAFGSVAPLLPLFIQTLGVTAPDEAAFWAGIAHFASSLGAFFSGPFWGNLADRYGRRSMLLRATVGGIVVLALTGLSPNVAFLIVMRVLHGTFTGVNTAASALAASQASAGRTGLALGSVQMAFFLGNMVGPLFGGLLADRFGYHVPFFVMSGVLLIDVLLAAFFVREKFTPAASGKLSLNPLSGMNTVLQTAGLLPLLGLLFASRFGGYSLAPIMAVFMQQMAPERAATMAGIALGLVALASALSALAIGRLVPSHRHFPVFLVASLAASALFFPQFWVQSAILSIALVGLFGLCQGTMLTCSSSLVSNTVSKGRQGAVFGVVQSATALSHGTAGLAAGTLSVTLGVRSVFVADGALFLAIAAGAWWLVRRNKQKVVIPERA